MSTRANVLIGDDEIVAHINSSACPVDPQDPFYAQSIWKMMLDLDAANVTQAEFVAVVVKEASEQVWTADGLLPDGWQDVAEAYGGTLKGRIGNWDYEYAWFPFEPPAVETDWDNWRGRIFVRKVDSDLTWHTFGASHMQVPGPFVPIKDWNLYEASEEALA